MMRESLKQSTGQQEPRNDNYQVVRHSQDMATIIYQAITAHPSHFSQYALVIIALNFTPTKAASYLHTVAPEQSARYILNTLRQRIRQSDLIWLKDTTYYFLLPEADLQGGNIVQNRLWNALQENILALEENVASPPWSMTIGHSAYPEPAHTLEECFKDAQIVQMQFEVPWHDNDRKQALSPAEPDLLIMARQFGVPYLSFLPRTFSNKVKRVVRPELARELHCFPLGCTHNTLTVAMSNPKDNQVLDRLQSETGMRIFPVLIHPDELENALAHINT